MELRMKTVHTHRPGQCDGRKTHTTQWVDAILIPIPKKRNLHCYANWRGIALLDVVGKVAARIVQTRLQTQQPSRCFLRYSAVRQLGEKAF